MKLFYMYAAVLLLALSCVASAFGATAVRFVHAVSGASAVDVQFSSLPLFLNRAPLSASSVRSELPAMSYPVQVRDTAASSSTVLLSTTMAVTDGLNQSLVFAGQPGNYTSLALSWDRSLPQPGNIKVRFVHVAPSVTEPLIVLVGGSLFFQPLSPMSATNFIEVPLAQASSLSYVLGNSSAELAKFTAVGKLEAGNVYTVYFVEGVSEYEARVVNETTVDDQSPMVALTRSGVKFTLRVVNTVNAGAQTWTANSLPLVSSVAPLSASAPTSVYMDAAPGIAVFAAGSSTPLAEKTLTVVGVANRFTLVSYGVNSAMQILQLSTSATRPTAGNALVRVAHTAVGTADVEIVRDNTPVVASVAYGAASDFVSVVAQQQLWQVRRADTKAVLAEFSLSPASVGIYTLFLTAGAQGVEVRQLDEELSAVQSPLAVLNVQSVGSVKLRTVNLANGKPLRVATEKAVVNDRLEYGHAGAIDEQFKVGVHLFAAADADAPEVELASVGGDITEKKSYLVAFLGTPMQGFIYSNGELKLSKDSVLVRFVNAMSDVGNLRITDDNTGRVLADKLAFGDASAFQILPKGDRGYRLYNGEQQVVAVLTDAYTAHDILTIFLVSDKAHKQIIAYVLPDEAAEQFSPMPQFSAAVGVSYGFTPVLVASPRPNPAFGRVSVPLTLLTPADVAADVVDLSGRVVAGLPAAVYSAGAQEIAFDCSALAPGLYIVRLSIDGKMYSWPLTIQR